MTDESVTQQEALDMPEQRMVGSLNEADAVGHADLTLSQAARLYDVSLRTLRRLVALEDIPARKVGGVRGDEWRVTASALRSAGYALRVVDLVAAEDPSQSEIRRLKEALAAEQARSSDLDGRLGYALLTVGRLRGRLREAGINPDELFGADLEAGGGRGLSVDR